MPMKPMQAPSPNLGDCSKKGKWSDVSLVDQCKQCVVEPDMFFCDGECMNRYDLNSMCPSDSLVAKTVEQCENPCVQVGNPPTGGGCSDKFDCDWKNGETCEVKSDKERGLVGTCKSGDDLQKLLQTAKVCKDSTECDTKNHEFCSMKDGVGTCERKMLSGTAKVLLLAAVLVLLVLIVMFLLSLAKSKRVVGRFDDHW